MNYLKVGMGIAYSFVALGFIVYALLCFFIEPSTSDTALYAAEAIKNQYHGIVSAGIAFIFMLCGSILIAGYRSNES